MRILVHGFTESPAATARAIATFARARDVELVGWVARPRFEVVFGPEGPACERFEEPFPDGAWHVPLGADPHVGLDDALADENLRYLLDREQRFADQYEVTLRRSEILCRAQEILDATAPDVFILSDVPHSALSYALYLVARARHITTLLFRAGPAPHLFAFSDDVDGSLHEFVTSAPGYPTTATSASPHTVTFVERLGRTYEEAAPAYMSRQLARSGLVARAWSTVREKPRELASRDAIPKARAHLRRAQLRREYERRAVGASGLSGPFVGVFLHLQPERSTTPEGGFFAQQWLVVHALAVNVPRGWSVVVREHPSTFFAGPRLVRSTGFYDSLLAIPGVQLASLDIDPFDLVDRSDVVATITGSVGFEAVARGTPSLLFGNAAYRGCPGTHHIAAPRDTLDALSAARQGASVDRADLIEFLAQFERSPWVATTTTHTDDIEAAVKSGEAHETVIERMLRYLRDRVVSEG